MSKHNTATMQRTSSRRSLKSFLNVFQARAVWTALAVAATLNISLPAHAEVVDPAPVSDDTLRYIYKAINLGVRDPLIDRVNRKMDETTQLVERLAQYQSSNNEAQANETRSLLHANAAEIRTLRDAVAQRAPKGTATPQLNTIQIKGKPALNLAPLNFSPAQQIPERFERMTGAIDALANADARGFAPALAHMRKVLSDLRPRNQAQLDQHLGDVPTWTQGKPTKVKPEDLPKATEPRYLADNRRAPGGNVYAFLGNTLLAALPDPTPPEATTCAYNASDLNPTLDVQITPDIQALAEKLGYSPVKIFQYVSQKIGYEPYFGSLKGSAATLMSKAGGPTDQASLLIALLRASKIPARYVRGQIQFSNDARGLQWIGAKDYPGAKAILKNGGITADIDVTDINNKKLWLDHVWVEACVPYGNYRGSKVDKTGFRWIPLDPSFKEKSYQAGIVIGQPFDYATFYQTYLAKRDNGPDNLPQEAYAKQVEANLKTLPPKYENNTIQDVPYQGTVVPRTFDILPASLPYQVNSFTDWGGGVGSEVAEVPDLLRYKLEISGAQLTAPGQLNLVDIALKRVTLSFVPNTPTDQSNYEAFLTTGWPAATDNLYNILSVSSGVIEFQPKIYGRMVVKVDGTEKFASPSQTMANMGPTYLYINAYGTTTSWSGYGWPGVGDLSTCTPSGICIPPPTMSMTLRVLLNGTAVNQVDFTNKIKAWELYAIFANAYATSDDLLRTRAERLLTSVRNTPDPNANTTTLDDTIGEYMNLVGLKYMRYIDDAHKRIGGIDGTSGWDGNHLGLVSTVAQAQYLYDMPYALSNSGYFKGMLVDFPGGQDNAVDLITGKVNWKSHMLGGYTMSAYESYVWQENGRADAVSTVRGIQYANEKGIEVLTVNYSNWAAQSAKFTTNTNPALNYPAATITALQALVNGPAGNGTNGSTLTLPRSLIQYDNWTGTIYVEENQTQGLAGFTIGGGYAGGYLTLPEQNIFTPPSWYVPDNYYTQGLGVTFTSPIDALSYNNVMPAQISSIVGLGFAPNNTMSNDPVNMVTGNMYHTERDITTKGRGGLPIVFERSYNSRDTKDGPLGFGWTHGFNQYLSFEDDNQDGIKNAADTDGLTSTATWVDGTGARKFINVTGTATGVAPGSIFTPPPGFHFTTVRNPDGTFTITEKDGMVYTFEGSVGGTVGQKARLIKITDRNGNYLNLSYAPTANCNGTYVCSVTDALSRSLTFKYTAAGYLSDLLDWSGRTFKYVVDTNKNLVSFSNPLAVAGKQNVVNYTYFTSDPRLNHAMTKYTLPNGNGMTFQYYTNGKVFKHYTTLNETTTFTYNEFRRETVVLNEIGHTRHFFYDANGNLIQLVDENGAKYDYVYDFTHPSQRLSKRDPEGYLTSYTYDANGNVTQVTNPSTNTIVMSDYNGFNLPGKIKDARGNYTVRQYDTKGNLTNEIVLKHGIGAAIAPASYFPAASDLVAWTIHTYDSYGNRLTTKRVRDFVSKIGPIFTYVYDTQGLNVVNYKRQGDKNGDGILEAEEISPALVYDGAGRPTTDLNANWYPVTKTYDSVDRIVQMSDAVGGLRDFKYDANGNPIEQSLVQAPYGTNTLIDHSSAQYDQSDRKIASLDSAGNATAYTYDAAGNVIQIANPDNYSLSFDYDAANHVIKAYDQGGHAVSKTLDIEGKPRTVTDPNGNTVTYDYYGSPKDGRLKSVTDAVNHVTSYDYDENGNTISVTLTPNDASPARMTLTSFDELNRPVRIRGPVTSDSVLGAYRPVTLNAYDNLGHLVTVTATRTSDLTGASGDMIASPQVSYLVDDFGRKIKETDPLGNFWKFDYDGNNNLVKVTDAKNKNTQYTYTYGGQLQTRIDANNQKTQYTYNALGQVLLAQSPTVNYGYRYDNAHRLIKLTDSRNDKQLSYAWSPGGLLNTLTDNDGNRTDYLYDPVGRLSGIWAPNDDYTAFSYDAGGRLIEKWFPNGVDAQFTWNNDNTLASLNNKGAAGVISSHVYGYDGVGNRNSGYDIGHGSFELYGYTYDELNRLIQVKDTRLATGTTVQENYTYDPLGNRSTKTANGATIAYVYDVANQLKEIHQTNAAGPLTTAMIYDADGNLSSKCEGAGVTTNGTSCSGATTTGLFYDALNRLTQTSKTGQANQSYAYDNSGRRIAKTVGSTTTNFVYSGPDIVAEYATTWGAPLAQYTHGPNPDEPIERITPTMAQYYHHDGLGSVVAVSNNSNGAVDTQRFDAWGNQIAQSGTQPRYGYTGRELDETGLIFFRSRYLDPSTGRFTQRDPIGLQGGINQYAYVNNNPLNFTDPSGNFPQAIQMAEADLNRSYAPVINYQTSTGTQSLATLYHRDDSNDFAGKAVDTLSSLLPGAGVVEAFSQASQGNIGMAVLALATEIPAFKGLKAESSVLGAVERDVAGGVANANRIMGERAVDSFITHAESNGFNVVGREVTFGTPFGNRRVDVVLQNIETGAIGGVEIKSTPGAFTRFDRAARQQSAADWWINTFGADSVGQHSGLSIDNTIKLLWQAPK